MGTDGTTSKKTVGAGTYFVNETFDSPTDPTDYDTTLSCFNDANDNGIKDGSEPVVAVGANNSVPAATDDHVICAFTNSRKAQLRLKKELVPAADDGKVDFSLNGGPAEPTVVLGYGHGQQTAFKNAVLDNNTASESGHAPTVLADYVSVWSCSNGTSGTGSSITAADNLDLAYGDQVTCTFTTSASLRSRWSSRLSRPAMAGSLI